MALVPTIETLLFEIRKSFGLSDDKTSKNKHEFLKVDENLKSHAQLYAELKSDLYSSLSIKESDGSALDTQFFSSACMQIELSQSIYTRDASDSQVAWLFASHIIIPAVAKVLAIWQRDNQMDTGMPADTFWYLPKVEHGRLVLPVEQTLEWIKSLISIEAKDSNLIDQIYGIDNSNGKSSRLGVERSSIQRNLKNWQKRLSPVKTVKNLHDYFADDLKIDYQNTFERIPEEPFNLSIQRAKSYIRKNSFSTDYLCREFQSFSKKEIEKALESDESNAVSLCFLEEMYRRFSAPPNDIIRLRLHFAVAAQDMYMRFGKLLYGKLFKPHSVCYKENILNQLIHLFCIVYNETYNTELELNPKNISSEKIYKKCDAALAIRLDHLLPNTLVDSINKVKGGYGVASTAEWLNHLFLTNSTETGYLQIFRKENNRLVIHEEYQEKYREYNFHYQAYSTLALNEGLIVDCPSAYSLMLVGRDESIAFETRWKALDRLSKTEWRDPIMWAYYLESEMLLVDSILEVGDSALNWAEYLLEQVSKYSLNETNKPLYLYIEARTKMFKKQYKEAVSTFKEANKASKKVNSGRMRGITARYVFMIDAATKTNGYYLGNYDCWYREMCMFGGFPNLANGVIHPEHHAMHWHFSESKMMSVIFSTDFTITPSLKDTEAMLIEYFNSVIAKN